MLFLYCCLLFLHCCSDETFFSDVEVASCFLWRLLCTQLSAVEDESISERDLGASVGESQTRGFGLNLKRVIQSPCHSLAELNTGTGGHKHIPLKVHKPNGLETTALMGIWLMVVYSNSVTVDQVASHTFMTETLLQLESDNTCWHPLFTLNFHNQVKRSHRETSSDCEMACSVGKM